MTTPAADDDELPIRINLESGEELVWPDPNDLRELVNRIGGDKDHFLILDRVPHSPRCFMQTYRNTGADFELEFRDGDNLQFQAYVHDPDAVVRTMLSWAVGAPDWKSAHDWELAFQHALEEAPPLDDLTDSMARVQALEQMDVGYNNFATIARNISEASEPDNPITLEQAMAVLEPLWIEQVAEQASWPEVTDVDRVDNAFLRLADAGITARAHFACCLRCGTGEIRDEADEQDRGYVFFHNQDSEHAAFGGPLSLGYGAYSRDPAEGVAIGYEVVAALRAEGLSTEWSGSIDKRIAVKLDWKKRLE